MRFLLRSFFRGLLVVVPVVTTLYILVRLFSWLDGLVPWPESMASFRGAGVLLIFLSMVVVGALASNVVARWFFRGVERLFERLPLVKLIYSSLRDLISAFVGDAKKFEAPVAVRIAGQAKILGFITRTDMAEFGMADHVAVYFPQSYNFAGQVMLVPRDDVTILEAASSDVMTFIVSGGVSGERAVEDSPAEALPA